MKTKASITLIMAVFTALCLHGQQAVMDEILADTTLTGTSYSFCFADAITGEIVYAYDADRNLAPASVMKLYSTSTALSFMGPDYRFRTAIYLSGKYNMRRGVLDGDVVIRGGGDPSLGSEYFTDYYGDVTAQWVAALRAAGLKRVRGRVAAAESIYDLNPAPDGWAWGDLGQYYGAGVYDLNINDNKFNIYVRGLAEGQPALIDSVEEYGRDISLVNYLTSSGRSDNGYVYYAPYSTSGWIMGSVPADSIFALKASIPDPPLAMVKKLEAALRAAGVKIGVEASASRATIADTGIIPVYATLSPSLAEIVKVTNNESVNMYAEALRKHLGYAVMGDGTFRSGSMVIMEFLDSIGCEPRQAVILDGSGLSSNNNISSLMTVRLLVYMYNSRCSAAFVGSLPEGAVSGTMKNYFRDEVFKGRVVAKTGTISSAKSFAGYVTANSGRRLAFTMFANGFTVPSRRITDNMEKIVKEIILNY